MKELIYHNKPSDVLDIISRQIAVLENVKLIARDRQKPPPGYQFHKNLEFLVKI